MPSELQEALTAAGAAALINKIVSPAILEYQRRYSPVVRAIPSEKWDADSYYFNTRNAYPSGGFVNDGGARVVAQSIYTQNSFQMRHFQTNGAVTGYAEAVTRALAGGSLRQKEVDGAIQSQMMDLENAVVWGNERATTPGPYQQFDGLDAQIDKYVGSEQNCIDCSGFENVLHALDCVADLVENNAAMNVFDASWMFVMSPTAISRIAQTMTLQQRFFDKVEVAAGLNVDAYRGIPLMKSSFLSSRTTPPMTVVGAAGPAPAGGTIVGALAAGAYTYQVSAIIARKGEITASAPVTVSGVTANQCVTLQFVVPSGPDYAGPVLYKVYRTDPFGNVTMLGTVDAVVGLAADGLTPVPTVQIMDTGATLIPLDANGNHSVAPPSYVGTNRGRRPLAAGEERFYLMSRDPNYIVRPYVRQFESVPVYPTVRAPDSLPFSIMTDTTLAVRGPKFLGCGTGLQSTLALT